MRSREELPVPRGERIWKRFSDSSGTVRFFITSKQDSRDFYFLYELQDGAPRKLGRARSPLELERKYDVENVLKKSKQ